MRLIQYSSVSMPESLPKALNVLHDLYGLKDEQTVRNGTQVNIEFTKFKSIRKLVEAMKPQIDAYFGSEWKFHGIWTSRMGKGGYHVAHNHPKGEVSGCYYVNVGKGGNLRINEYMIEPQKEMLVLFDSTVPHGTTEYEGEEPRLTVAFDVVRA